jgi:aldose sugar dehydrogenase
MQKIKTIIAALLVIYTTQVTAQTNTASALDSIQSTIQFYLDGWATGDTTKIGKAMHTSCQLKFYRENTFTIFSRNEYLSRFKPKERLATLVTRIVSVDITENIASAKIEIVTEKDIYTDYFNLIRTKENWFIVDKVSVRKAR